MSFTRRQFIKRGVTFVGAGLAAPRFLLGPGAVRAQAPGLADRILVIVELEGGNDGLNTVVPYANSLYRSYRPGLALRAGEYIELNDSLGLHGSMGALKALYDQNRVAIVQGVGYPNPNRSHFRSTEIWQTANPDAIVHTGWLGRYLDATIESADSDLEGISVTTFTPAALGAAKATSAAIESLDSYGLNPDTNYPGDEANKLAAFAGLYDDLRGGSGSTLDFLANVGLTAFTSSKTLRDAAGGYEPAVAYPQDPYGLGANLQLIAQMISADIGTNVYYTSLGSFDTHANQRGVHAALLGALSEGLAAFYQDLTAHGRGDDLLVMTFSEFGRRVDENSSDGTDHGAAAPLFVLGNSVAGGIYGDHPSLSNLGDGDLIHEIDFRAVYTTVLRHWLEADAATILGDTFEDVGFLQTPAARKAAPRRPVAAKAAPPERSLPTTMAELDRSLGNTLRPAQPASRLFR